MAALLSVRNIEAYYGPIMAIHGVSLSVPEGKVVTILGANGAGKTSVLKTISGALNSQKGSVLFHGQEISGLEPNRIAALGIGHVPEGREIFPLLSVADHLRMGAFTRRGQDISGNIEMVYAYFPPLAECRKQPAGLLSGGQQQMLAMGRALMMKPRVMLLDEPSLGLSPRLVGEIANIVIRLNAEQGMTVLLVEQNVKMALDISSYGYVMESGRIVMEDSCERLARSTDIQEFYLGYKDHGARGRRRWKQRKTWR